MLAAADSPLPGRHNLDNIALALAVIEAAAGDCGPALAQLGSFRGLPHRLERIEDAGGGVWINDSISTTPYATLAALQSDPAPVILICGGQERGADWSGVAEYLRMRPLLGVVGLPDNGQRVVSELVAAGAVDSGRQVLATSIEQAVELAAEWRRPGVRVVLSPGAPSFPRFRDFEERGERFRRAVTGLIGRD